MKAQSSATVPFVFQIRQDLIRQAMGWSVDYLAALAALFFLFIKFLLPDALQLSALSFIIAGFIFPGMAHGALDYHLGTDGSPNTSKKIRILASYIGSMVLGILLWLTSPLLILLLFLINSAYHFGETDLTKNSSAPFRVRLVYGAALILFFFTTHAAETASYLLPFGVSFPTGNQTFASIFSGILYLMIFGIVLRHSGTKNAWNILLVLALGTQLPLLLSFGIYYILNHSLSAWNHLRHGLDTSHSSMLKKAAPFTIAGLFFIALSYYIFQRFDGFQGQHVPLVIIGLSAITLPHTFSMSFFYRKLNR